MKVRWICLLVTAVFLVGLTDADARRRKRSKRRGKKAKVAQVASKKTTVAIGRLLAPFKWGMSSNKVKQILEKGIRKGYAKRLKAASKEPLEYDRLRRSMMGDIKKLRKNVVSFVGKKVSWDVSMVDSEYAHKNNESMMVRWGSEDRRFYFFHHDRLWKVFIAFNSDMFRGKTFADFATAMEGRFGRADRKYRATIKGDAQMAYLHWPPSKTSILRAVDKTRLYGNFCLVMIDRNELPRVQEGRKMNSPKKRYSDPLIDAVTKEPGNMGEENEDVVDQLTGRGSRVPVRSDTYSPTAKKPSRSSSSSSPGSYTPPKRKRKKLDSKNPLDGLDL